MSSLVSHLRNIAEILRDIELEEICSRYTIKDHARDPIASGKIAPPCIPPSCVHFRRSPLTDPDARKYDSTTSDLECNFNSQALGSGTDGEQDLSPKVKDESLSEPWCRV